MSYQDENQETEIPLPSDTAVKQKCKTFVSNFLLQYYGIVIFKSFIIRFNVVVHTKVKYKINSEKF